MIESTCGPPGDVKSAGRSPGHVMARSPLLPRNYGRGFLAICRAAVLALNAEIRYSAGESEWHWECTVAPRAEPLHPALRLFPPLFCAPYEGSAKLKVGDSAVNEQHPFTQWLLEVAQDVADAYPGLLTAIRSELCSFEYGQDFEVIASNINASVARLRELDRDLAPRGSLGLSAEDFE